MDFRPFFSIHLRFFWLFFWFLDQINLVKCHFWFLNTKGDASYWCIIFGPIIVVKVIFIPDFWILVLIKFFSFLKEFFLQDTLWELNLTRHRRGCSTNISFYVSEPIWPIFYYFWPLGILSATFGCILACFSLAFLGLIWTIGHFLVHFCLFLTIFGLFQPFSSKIWIIVDHIG